MRMKMVFQLKKSELPIEYRRTFLSLLKKCFQMASDTVYRKFYETGTTMKPFTFSLFLPSATFKDEKVILSSNVITLNFSTSEKELGIYFYNSLIRTRFEPFSISNDNTLRIKSIHLKREKKITSREIIFKTLSPFLVRMHNKETNKDKYLIPKDDQFIPQLKTITKSMLKELAAKEEEVEIEPLILKKIPIKHYNELMEANSGTIKISGNLGILSYIYEIGLGSRRSEGFGMLEVNT